MSKSANKKTVPKKIEYYSEEESEEEESEEEELNMKSWTETYAQTRERKICEKIDQIMIMLELPDIVYESTIIIYKNIVDHNKKNIKFRTTTLNSVLAGCTLKACEINNIDCIIEEVCNCYNIHKKDLNSVFKKFFPSEYVVDINHYRYNKTYMYSVCSKLGLSLEIINFCIDVSNNCSKLNLIDYNPMSATAGIIYFVSKYKKLDLSLNLLSDIVGINKMSISKICKELMTEPYATVIIDSELTELVCKDLFNK